MHFVAAIALGVLLAASFFFVAQGVGVIIRKRRRGGVAALLGLGLFATYVLLLGAAAYQLGTAELEGTTLEPQHKARILAEGISLLMNTTVVGVLLGVLGTAVAFVRRRLASRGTQ